MTTTTIATRKRDEQLLTIAQNEMNEAWGEGAFETLDTRGSDDLDFYTVGVWTLKAMLRKAYSAGYEAAVTDRR